MHVLLVEPNYYATYPPLGLLKLSAWHKRNGDTTELVKGCVLPRREPDLIYVTSLYTWGWRAVEEAIRYYRFLFPRAKLVLGGLYASLLYDHAVHLGADEVYRGIFAPAEDLLPDYDLVPGWQASIVFASRGCNFKCGFCAVPILEGRINSVKRSIKHLIKPGHKKVIFFDNNFFQNPYWRDILGELEEMGLEVDFNQGIDARLITDEVAERLSRLKLPQGIKIRLGYDFREKGPYVKKAIERLSACNIKGREILVYVLFNYTDDPQDFFERVRDVLEWGAIAYPMRYEPIYTLEKNKYVSEKWDPQRLELVQKFRRIVGTRGALPPFEALVEKFRKAKSFDEAFSIYRK